MSAFQLGIVMDPIESIHPAKDSTLAMMLAARRRGWELVVLQQGDLRVRDGIALGDGCRVEVMDDNERWFERRARWSGRLGELDALLMRKDPPFDMEYVHTTYILQRAEQQGCAVFNAPQALRDINEKGFVSWFPQCTPPTLITRRHSDLRAFLAEHGHAVVKPLDSMGGRSIFAMVESDPNRNVILETLTEGETRFVMAQRYIPEIADGDKRILLIDGEPVERLLARVPAADDFRGNLVLGARGEGRELGVRDRWIAEEVGPELKRRGVVFAGLDVIGDYLTEVNVTSPTGIRELEKEYGLDIAGSVLAAIERRLET